jgi:hypothetical protein
LADSVVGDPPDFEIFLMRPLPSLQYSESASLVMLVGLLSPNTSTGPDAGAVTVVNEMIAELVEPNAFVATTLQ